MENAPESLMSDYSGIVYDLCTRLDDFISDQHVQAPDHCFLPEHSPETPITITSILALLLHEQDVRDFCDSIKSFDFNVFESWVSTNFFMHQFVPYSADMRDARSLKECGLDPTVQKLFEELSALDPHAQMNDVEICACLLMQIAESPGDFPNFGLTNQSVMDALTPLAGPYDDWDAPEEETGSHDPEKVVSLNAFRNRKTPSPENFDL